MHVCLQDLPTLRSIFEEILCGDALVITRESLVDCVQRVALLARAECFDGEDIATHGRLLMVDLHTV